MATTVMSRISVTSNVQRQCASFDQISFDTVSGVRQLRNGGLLVRSFQGLKSGGRGERDIQPVSSNLRRERRMTMRAEAVKQETDVGVQLKEASCDGPVATTDAVEVEIPEKELERDFVGTPYIPVYVMLPLNTINQNNEVTDPESLKYDLRALKSVSVDGVMVDCWWGIVEGKAPQQYNWNGYSQLFSIVREAGLKLQVVMSFHQCGGNVGDDTYIPIPAWVLEIGEKNPDIFFTDRNGNRNPECLSWGVDKERVLAGRTGLEVCYDYMRSFRSAFDEFFEDGTITEIEVGLGACGELRFPSYPESLGWKYPGIGEFPVYDKYLQKALIKAAVIRGHADFEGYKIAAKVSGIHWWYLIICGIM